MSRGSRGHTASWSVAYLEVPRIFARARVPGAAGGTGFLVNPQHNSSAFHVVEARDRPNEELAARADLDLQVQAATAAFDYTEGVPDGVARSTQLPLSELVAFDAALDYAVVRLQTPVTANPLTLWRGGLPTIEPGLGFVCRFLRALAKAANHVRLQATASVSQGVCR
jgi:hypothetical protein